MADNDKAGRRIRPSRGWFVLTGVAVALGATVVGASYWVTSRHNAPNSHVSSAPSTNNNTPGGKANPHYNKLVSQQNQQKEQKAEKSGQSFMPTVVNMSSGQSFKLATHSKAPTQAPPPTPVDLNTSAEPSQPSQHKTQTRAQPAQQSVGARNSAMVNELKHIMKQEAPAKAVVAVYNNAQTQSGNATGSSSGTNTSTANGQTATASTKTGSQQSGKRLIKPGTIFYAVMDTALDSDQPGPAMASVVSGPYKGAKVLGSFKRHKDNLVVQFSRLIPKSGPVIPIKAYAVNTATTRTAVATAVDHHYLARWGGLIAASFMEGFGRAVEQSGATVVNSVGGGGASSLTIHPSRTAGAEAEQALGTVGQKAGQQIQKNFNEPPTVKVAAGTAIDVLIIRGNKHASTH